MFCNFVKYFFKHKYAKGKRVLSSHQGTVRAFSQEDTDHITACWDLKSAQSSGRTRMHP